VTEPVNIEWSFLMHKCNKNVSHLSILNGHFYCINVTKKSVTCKYWMVIFTASMEQKRQSPVNIELSILLFCYIFTVKRNNSILTGDWLFSYIYAVYAVKRVNSILTGDWRFCFIFTVKRTNSILTGDWSFCSPVNIEWSFLLHQWSKNASHLLILNCHFYFINVTQTAVTR
jgi:hypothetical protein